MAKINITGVLKTLYRNYSREQSSSAGDPVGGLIGTILSQNTSDINSRRAYESLKFIYPTWEQIADAPVREIESAIRVGGLAKIKAPRIKNILRQIRIERGRIELDYLGELKTDEVLTQLTRFDGVGLKTAACVALFALGRDVCPVDTHVHRIVKRLDWIPENTGADKAFHLLRKIIPKDHGHSAHIALIRHGRTVCRPKPKCDECSLKKKCPFSKKGT